MDHIHESRSFCVARMSLFAGLWGVLSLPGLGCSESTQMRVDIVGDFQVPDEVERLVVEFRGNAFTFQTSHELRPPSRRLHESLILYPGPSLSESVEIRVRGEGESRTLALATGNAAFQQNQSVSIELRLQPSNANEPSLAPEDDDNSEGNIDALPMRWLDGDDDVP